MATRDARKRTNQHAANLLAGMLARILPGGINARLGRAMMRTELGISPRAAGDTRPFKDLEARLGELQQRFDRASGQSVHLRR